MLRVNLTKRNWIVTVLLSAASFAYVFAVFLPGQKTTRELRAELHQRQQYIIDADRLVFAIEQTRSEAAEATDFVEQWRRTSGDRGAISALFGQMMALAKEHGVLVTRFDPQPRVAMESIAQIPAIIACEGTYAQVVNFLGALEALTATIWIDEMTLEPVLQKGGLMRSEIKLRVFADNSENAN